MMDPVTLVLVVTCIQGVTKLTDALCQWLLLRARGELARAAAVVPPGVEVADRGRDGASWLVRRTHRQQGGVRGR
jgi:hypothetical protein